METKVVNAVREVTADPIKIIPKYSTNIGLKKLSNGNVVFSFLHTISDSNPPVLIETIIIDGDHAKRFADGLQEFLEANK